MYVLSGPLLRKEALVNLDTCTPGQRQIITTLDKPLMVSAGAGSGKTFTLTQRIAYALSEGGPDASPLQSIDQVMAITFTKKAAAELKSRIKRQLAGMGLVEEALKVDDAWISTIHGMCSRVLREHALELGIDPAFSVISETESKCYYDEAFDIVIKRIQDGNDAALKSFVGSLDVYSQGAASSSIEAWVHKITSRALALPGGFDAVVVPEVEGEPSALMRQMVELGETFVSCLEGLPKQGKTDAKNHEAAAAALEMANEYLLEYGGCTSFSDPDFEAARFVEAFFSFPKTSPKYRVKESDPTFFAEYRDAYAFAAGQVEAAFSACDVQALLRIARAVDEEYQRLKGAANIDNVDLLRMAYHALADCPEIADAYRRQFKIIMIDEFQDTDELQVALVRALAQPGLSNVCTVGDAQQSIYRFRGADVNVFFGYRESLEAECPEAQFVSLPDNFRSHADVLSFVDKVFSQPQVFGNRFLSLAPKGAVNNQEDPLFEMRPRVSMALFDCRVGGPGLGAGRLACARRIAEHFAGLRDDPSNPASPSDMVLLLGNMSNVGVYAQALRDAGFECLVAGGSTFSNSQEVKLVASVVRLFSSCTDNEALYAVLTSPLFALGDDALLHLATGTNRQGRRFRRTLADGFAAWKDEKGLTGLAPEQEDQIDFAHICLDAAFDSVRRFGVAAGVRTLLRSSGWLIRLEGEQAQGQAIVGNLGKALRILEDVEKLGLGLARTADRFESDLATLKLAPGTLSASSSNFVRIMTVHASKGLEFPHVALADLRLSGKAESLVAENIAASTYVGLDSPMLRSVRKTIQGLHEFIEQSDEPGADIMQASTYQDLMLSLKGYVASQELSEARRLLYVALTRASRSLFIGVAHSGNKNFSYEGKGILDDLHEALQWEASANAPMQKLDYGGSAPMDFELTVLDTPAERVERVVEEGKPFTIPASPLPPAPYCQPYHASREEVFSYSSIGDASHWNSDPDEAAELSMFEVDQAFFEENATALGTAFHRLAQRAIAQFDGVELKRPAAEVIAAQVRAQGLTPSQEVRLSAALDRWFASDIARLLVAKGVPRAEVPFMVCLGVASNAVYLEGEIDAVSFDGDGSAFLVDYKTGGSPDESAARVFGKHLLQAQCYALALMAQGSPRVTATFVRVEQESVADASQPQTVEYTFTEQDREVLEQAVLSAYAQSLSA